MTADDVVAQLKAAASPATLSGMARYGIEARCVLGVTMAQLLKFKASIGKNQALSLALWETGIYEARLLAGMIGDPASVTAAQMDAWAGSFENWADCDTVCFHLFDRTPARWEKAHQWAEREETYVKRAGFALMACLVAHDKTASEAQYLDLLSLIEHGAEDDRHIVAKGVSWALRMVGRATPARNAAAIIVCERLAASPHPSPRKIGREALRELRHAKVQTKLKSEKPKHLKQPRQPRQKEAQS